MVVSSFHVESVARPLQVDLLVVVPIYNEEANITTVLGEWLPVLREAGVAFVILALNDGSRDGTWKKLLELEASAPGEIVAIDKLNSGHGLTCRLGYDLAAASPATWVLQIDSDGQCDPGYFHEFWRRRDEADCLFGLRKTRDDGWARVVTSTVCTGVASLLTGTSLNDANVPYRLMRLAVLRKALPFVPRHFNVQNVALAVILRRMPGIRWHFVPIHFRDRQGGSNSINLLQVAKLGMEMLLQIIQLPRPSKIARRIS